MSPYWPGFSVIAQSYIPQPLTRNRDVLHLASTRVKLGCIIDARSPTLVEARRVKLKKLGV